MQCDKFLQERTIACFLPKIPRVHTHSTLQRVCLHNRRSQLAVQMNADGFRYDFVCSIGYFEQVCVETCCICWICGISDISYHGLGGRWVLDKLRSSYGMIVTFNNYGRPLNVIRRLYRTCVQASSLYTC